MINNNCYFNRKIESKPFFLAKMIIIFLFVYFILLFLINNRRYMLIFIFLFKLEIEKYKCYKKCKYVNIFYLFYQKFV